MKRANLINDIIEGVEKLIKNIRQSFKTEKNVTV